MMNFQQQNNIDKYNSQLLEGEEKGRSERRGGRGGMREEGGMRGGGRREEGMRV